MDDSTADQPVVKDVQKNKDAFFGHDSNVKSNPWKIGNTLTLCYDSNNDPLITIGPHCNKLIYIYKIITK